MFLIRDIRDKFPSDARETRRRNSKTWGKNFRSSSDGLSSKSMKDFPWVSNDFRDGGSSSMVQILFLPNPCCSTDPPFSYWGKKTEIPPRAAFEDLEMALLLVNRSSSPRSFRQEVTCPPCKLTSTEAPRGLRSVTWSIPLEFFVTSTDARWSHTGAQCPISKALGLLGSQYLKTALNPYLCYLNPKNVNAHKLDGTKASIYLVCIDYLKHNPLWKNL